MPYITQENKDILLPFIGELVDKITETTHADSIEGVMNYTVTTLLNDCMIGREPRYRKINRAIGVLEAVKLEFYRRLAGPYEDGAIEKNGDIRVHRQMQAQPAEGTRARLVKKGEGWLNEP